MKQKKRRTARKNRHRAEDDAEREMEREDLANAAATIRHALSTIKQYVHSDDREVAKVRRWVARIARKAKGRAR